jgi:hypothetical protein
MSLMGIGSFKSSVEDLALEELGRLEETRQGLEQDLSNIVSEIKAIKAVLRAVNPTPVAKKKEPKKQVPFAMSEERESEAVQWITSLGESEITSKMMREQFPDWSDSYVNSALKEFRDQGVLRLSATSGSMNVYRSLL